MTLAFAAATVIWRKDPIETHDLSLDATSNWNNRNTMGLLRVHPESGQRFTSEQGKAIYLTGSHTWTNFQNISGHSQGTLDYPAYLRLLREKNHNFMRMWVWEQAAWAPWTIAMPKFHPLPYLRTGPGSALDGEPKFDLTRFNEAYFDRLRSRVSAARDNGIYVSVMLFQGWSVGKKPNEPGNPWSGHPFHRDNNVNGIDGDQNGDGEGTEVHILENPAIGALQQTYVRKVVDTLNDLNNVLWEICNEGNPESLKWQNHMATSVKNYELTKEKQHPVGITAFYPRGDNGDLLRSAADWISPSDSGGDYRANPPAANGSKVIIADTDHIWGVGGDRGWVWKSFVRGLNPIFMDPLDDTRWRFSQRKFESCRRAMGHTLAYADQLNLATIRPHDELASTGFCLANPGREYFIYVPFEETRLESKRFTRKLRGLIRNFRWLFKQKVTVNLSAASGTFLVEWFNPSTGKTRRGPRVFGGKDYSFTVPFQGDAALYLRKAE
jgi:hypothetical protein